MDERKNRASSMKTHLEFLGYETDLTENDGNIIVTAKSSTKANLLLFFTPNTTFIQSSWNGMKKMTTVEQYEFLNDQNRNTNVSRVFVDKDGDLLFRACFVGPYDKKNFGDFIDLVLSDVQILFGNEGKKVLLP